MTLEALLLADELLEPIEGFPSPTTLEKNAAALLRTQHAEIEASNRNLEQLTDELAQCRKEIESQTIVLDGMLARSVAIFERKDALLRQALDAVENVNTTMPFLVAHELRQAITKELAK